MKFLNLLKTHKRDILNLFLLILLYATPLILTITWGIPNPSHPFLYHMDEWHQFMSVRAVFKQLSNNVPGAAHGPMLQFLLTGFYLTPFYLLGLINPFVLKSALSDLDMQQKIFIVLRLNSILFGALSIAGLYIIAKKHLRINPILTSLFFFITPAWIMLSGYFKYDIALTFWIICSLGFHLHYRDHPTKKNFLLACGVCALALSTKIAALPIIPIFVISFFLFTPKIRQHLSWLIWGTAIFILTFCLVGIPDVLLHRGDYREFLYSNLISGPQITGNIKLGANEFFYLFFRHYPVIFGHAFFFLILVSFVFFILSLASYKSEQRQIVKFITNHKTQLFLTLSFLIFLFSILPLKMTATGNRSLVLLPFFAIFCALAIKQIKQRCSTYNFFSNAIIVTIILLQLIETFAWVSIKLSPDPRQISSSWIQSHIPLHSQIGLENVPIYQMIPDNILKDYYTGSFNPKAKTQFRYAIVNAKTRTFPPYIIISGAEYDTKYLKTSSKKNLVNRLKQLHYKKIAEFSPNLNMYYLFNNEINYYLSAIIPSNPISVYKNNK